MLFYRFKVTMCLSALLLNIGCGFGKKATSKVVPGPGPDCPAVSEGELALSTPCKEQPPADPEPDQVNPNGPAIGPESHDARTRLLRLYGDTHLQGASLQVDDINKLLIDDTAKLRCTGSLDQSEYKKVTTQLGGMQWADRFATSYQDLELPVFGFPEYNTPQYDRSAVASVSAESAKSAAPGSAAPTIARADKIGQYGNRVIYLSEKYGLFFVDVSGPTPKLSCSVLVPGRPKNFYVQDDKIHLITENLWDAKTATAVIAYSISDSSLAYAFSTVLENESIIDSRLFNSTLAVYTRHQKPPTETSTASSEKSTEAAAENSSFVSGRRSWPAYSNESMLTVFKIRSEKYEKAFEDLYTSSSEEMGYYSDLRASDVGKVVNRHTSPLSFMSASDRYLLIGRNVTETIVEKIQTQNVVSNTCVDYNPRAQEVVNSYCAPQYSFIENPAFDLNFRCPVDANFETCVSQNASKFSKGKWKVTGTQCQTHSYWMGQCLSYKQFNEQRTWPVLRSETKTTVNIYKFEEGDFFRLDDPQDKNDDLSIRGSALEHKSFNFQNGYLYSVMSVRSGISSELSSEVSSFKLLPDALVAGGTLSGIAPGESLKAVLFSGTDLYFVTFREVDPLFTVGLSNPGKPVIKGELKVPGYSGQLIADGNSLLGIGRIDTNDAQRNSTVWKPKVSLYDISNSSNVFEIGTDLFGKDVSYASTNAENDDQVYHYASGQKTLFVPLVVSQWNQTQEICQNTSFSTGRIAISTISQGVLESSEINMPEFIDRAFAFGSGKALTFGAQSVNYLQKTDSKWSTENIHLGSSTVGIYRVPGSDQIVAVQVKHRNGQPFEMVLRLGTRAQIEQNQAVSSLQVPAELLNCYREPRVRFFGKKVVLIFSARAWKDGEQKVSNHEFGATFEDGSLKALDQASSKLLAERPVEYCQIDRPHVLKEASEPFIEDYFAGKFECRKVALPEISVWNTLRCRANQMCESW